MYKKYVFDNGLRLVLCPMSEMRSVAIGVWVGVGGRYENDEICGVSHFLEHMLFKGTKKRTAAQISQSIEGIGGNMNAFTTEELTCFYVKVMEDHFKQAIGVLSDMFENPAFKTKDIDRERAVILEELRMNIDVPSNFVYELLRRIMWPKHPLGRMLIGTENTLNTIKRQNLIEFKNKNYSAQNMVIAIAGKINPHEVVHEVEKKFTFLKKNLTPSFAPARDGQVKSLVKIQHKKTEQTHFCIGVRSFHRNHPDRFALRVLNAILGENMSSRLFQEIREKLGLSYDISSSVERFLDTGSLVISGGVDIRHLPKVVEKTLLELEKLKRKPISKKELNMAKKYCVGQTSLELEKTSSQMIYIGESELSSGKIFEIDEIIRKVQSVTAEDIQKVAQKLFVDEHLNLAVIGPVKNTSKIENLFSLQIST